MAPHRKIVAKWRGCDVMRVIQFDYNFAENWFLKIVEDF